jgi:Protein of unknown function (DUF3574)
MGNQTTHGLQGRRRSWAYRIVLGVICLMCLGPRNAWADPQQCEFPGQKQMLLVQLFMGLDIPGHGAVTAKAWDSFLGSVVTPRFPDGFTVYDAYGQWWNPRTRSIAKENSKVVVIAAADSQGVRLRISEVSDAYTKKFRQISVGIVTSQVCASF